MLIMEDHLLFITLVHPDLLPPVYASAQAARDLGYVVSVVSSDSTVESNVDMGANVRLVTCGKYIAQVFSVRRQVRSKIRTESVAVLGNGNVKAIICFCPFSYLLALKIAGDRPVIYYALEVANYSWRDFKRSPLTTFRNFRTIRNLHRAAVLATPTVQRSARKPG